MSPSGGWFLDQKEKTSVVLFIPSLARCGVPVKLERTKTLGVGKLD
jgi:hypothetical protein